MPQEDRLNARRHLASGMLILAAGLVLGGCAKKTTTDDPNGPGGTGGTAENVPPKDGFENTSANPDARAPIPGTDDETVVGSAAWLESRLQPVYFAFDRYDLTQASRDTLTANARLLREWPTHSVIIQGHCDERGTNEYNLALGDRRARASRDFLIAAGIDAGRMSLVSYGEEQPAVVGHDESAWSMNRRAEFKVKRGA